jgi:predicted metal-dependent peptidase
MMFQFNVGSGMPNQNPFNEDFIKTTRRKKLASWIVRQLFTGFFVWLLRDRSWIDIAIAIDASGSINQDMLRDFLGEIQGIMDSFPAYKIHVVTFDTQAYNPQQYDSDNLDSICDYEVTGGGGTDFDCFYEYFKENDIVPRRLVVFTDGYPFGSWGDENYCEVTWILHGTTTIIPPWGVHAYYEEHKK